eukprot:gene34814-46762_t
MQRALPSSWQGELAQQDSMASAATARVGPTISIRTPISSSNLASQADFNAPKIMGLF